MEVHNNRTTTKLAAPDVVGLTVTAGQLWFHTESGQVIQNSQYRTECECRANFVGFCLFFILEEEDALTELRLTSTRLRHRIAVFRPKNNTDFALCMILFAIESLPLSRPTLEKLVDLLRDINPRTGLTRMIRRSCIKLICLSLYLFFDVTEHQVTECVPQICLLYKETQRAGALVLAQTYFGVRDIASMSMVSLSLTDRVTKDGDLVGELAAEVLNTVCNVFYVPVELGNGGNTVTRWLSNDQTPAHILLSESKRSAPGDRRPKLPPPPPPRKPKHRLTSFC